MADINSLPEFCFYCNETAAPGKFVVAIKRGETGYYATTYDELNLQKANELVNYMNGKLGVGSHQVEIMVNCSMNGWHILERISNYKVVKS